MRFWSQTVHSTLFRSADAVHVLAFSAVLLNTDLHNNMVRLRCLCSQLATNKLQVKLLRWLRG